MVECKEHFLHIHNHIICHLITFFIYCNYNYIPATHIVLTGRYGQCERSEFEAKPRSGSSFIAHAHYIAQSHGIA